MECISRGRLLAIPSTVMSNEKYSFSIYLQEIRIYAIVCVSSSKLRDAQGKGDKYYNDLRFEPVSLTC